MRIAFGSDDRTAVTESIVEVLRSEGHDVIDCGHPDVWADTDQDGSEAENIAKLEPRQ